MNKKSNQFTYQPPSQDVLNNIQKEYDETEISVNDLAKKYGFSVCKLYTLKKKGLIRLDRDKSISREMSSSKMRGKKLSEEVKRKISISRKKWIAENPDKSPYLMSHKSRGETYPEQYFRDWLEKENIPFQQEYKFKLYSFDFLVNERVDLEIDGDQHKLDERIITHDIKRDDKSKDAGFVVYRIMWSDYQKLSHDEKKNFLNELKNFLLDNSNPIPEIVIKKKQPKTTRTKQEDPRKKQALEMLKSGMNFCEVGREFKVSDNVIRKWLKSLGENPKDYGRDRNKKI